MAWSYTPDDNWGSWTNDSTGETLPGYMTPPEESAPATTDSAWQDALNNTWGFDVFQAGETPSWGSWEEMQQALSPYVPQISQLNSLSDSVKQQILADPSTFLSGLSQNAYTTGGDIPSGYEAVPSSFMSSTMSTAPEYWTNAQFIPGVGLVAPTDSRTFTEETTGSMAGDWLQDFGPVLAAPLMTALAPALAGTEAALGSEVFGTTLGDASLGAMAGLGETGGLTGLGEASLGSLVDTGGAEAAAGLGDVSSLLEGGAANATATLAPEIASVAPGGAMDMTGSLASPLGYSPVTEGTMGTIFDPAAINTINATETPMGTGAFDQYGSLGTPAVAGVGGEGYIPVDTQAYMDATGSSLSSALTGVPSSSGLPPGVTEAAKTLAKSLLSGSQQGATSPFSGAFGQGGTAGGSSFMRKARAPLTQPAWLGGGEQQWLGSAEDQAFDEARAGHGEEVSNRARQMAAQLRGRPSQFATFRSG